MGFFDSNHEWDEYLSSLSRNQQKVVRYFLQYPESDGCFSNKPLMTASEYLRYCEKEANKVTQDLCMEKLNVDKEDVSEIEPVRLEGFLWDKIKEGDLWFYNHTQTSLYQVTWLFFGKSQLYVYQCSFNLASFVKIERTEEYYYSDITSFSTMTDSDKRFHFCIIVPGDKFDCSVKDSNHETQISIQGMKSFLREKKV